MYIRGKAHSSLTCRRLLTKSLKRPRKETKAKLSLNFYFLNRSYSKARSFGSPSTKIILTIRRTQVGFAMKMTKATCALHTSAVRVLLVLTLKMENQLEFNKQTNGILIHEGYKLSTFCHRQTSN